MTLPIFTPDEDPGPSFAGLLGRLDLGQQGLPTANPQVLRDTDIIHGTTVMAARFADGVVIAGDRRATMGNLISHRSMNKVFAADRWSGVAIAGAAGAAMEMVKMFQLQLQHYEKLEGHALSLEGKANQLSQMLRANLPLAMQGMAVVPIFAGYDRRRDVGRLFAYDLTGGRFEETDYIASGSGSLFARTVIKMDHTPNAALDTAVDVMIKALFAAADDDSATGGPDSMRGIYPVVAVITADGYSELEEEDIAARFELLLAEYTVERGSDKS